MMRPTGGNQSGSRSASSRGDHALCMLTPVPVGISRPSNNPLPFKDKFQQLKLERSWLGWQDYSALRASPLRGRPRRVNTNNGANQSATMA
jgi:hypothetical protein